jgi:hypothetical protein
MKKYMTNKTAVIEIMIPLAYLNDKYKYQDVPLHALENRMVYLKKGASGNKMISTKNVKLLKVFNREDREGIEKYLDELRNNNINESIGTKKVIKGYLNENISNNPIEEVFKNNPELSNIGNVVQYSKYLETIFPDSKVKKILYHRSPEDFSGFDKSKTKKNSGNRFYFSPINTSRYGKYVKFVILNIKNLAIPYNDEFINDVNKKHPEYTEGKSQYFHLPSQIYVNANKYGYDGVYAYEGTNDDEYSVYEPEQIHVLGTKKDIEGFKKYVEVNNINESIGMKKVISEGLKYHLLNGISVNESIYRPGSESHIDLLSETRRLYDSGSIELDSDDEELFESTDIGRFGTFRGEVVPLDIFLIEYDGGKYEDDDMEKEIDIDEVEKYLKERGWGDLNYENFIDFESSDYYTGTSNSKSYANEMNKYMNDLSKGLIEGIIEEKEKKQPKLNKIKRNTGSGKKYVVYVKNPSTGNIKKITFGDKKGGLKARVGNSKARKSFSARHNCPKKKDRMTAGYWACRLNRSGLVKGSTSGYW